MFTLSRNLALLLAMVGLTALPVFAQAPPSFAPGDLDRMVARIALYPDPLLAQVLAAATYPNDIPPAAQWADQHHYLSGQALAAAITADQLPWEAAVQALLPFPSVLEMMAADMNWTSDLGNAFLASQPAVMDAVQRQRALAARYGYLRTGPQVVVGTGPYITIMPVSPAFVVVPAYDPAVVFFAPRPGFFVGGAVRFGFRISVGAYFGAWGWGGPGLRFDWGARRVWVNNVVWTRTWVNRTVYVHQGYTSFRRPAPNYVRPAEAHGLEARTEVERSAAREGREPPREEH